MNTNTLKALVKESGLSYVEIAEKCGITRVTLRNVLSGADVKISTLEKLAKVLDVPMSSFFNSVDNKISNTTIFVNDVRKDVSVVPLYDVDASAGLQRLFADGGNMVGQISIPNMPGADGAMHVTGDSMYPLLKSGDIIAYRILHDLLHFNYGEIYILQLEHDGDVQIVVKYVKKSEINGHVLLVSYNKEHDPVDVPVEWIKYVARVVFSIRKYSLI